ncbi:MAG: peptide ABC transporter substrate-binding protein [Phycisphaerales bacterium]
MLRLALPAVLIVVLVLGAVWSDRTMPRAEITYVDASPAFTLDPQRIAYEQDIRFGNALYEGLVRWHPETFDILPGIAERWEVGGEGVRYTFHLRENARWSNGDPVRAGDFVHSWRRGLLPDTAGDYSKIFFMLKGGRAFFEWRARELREYAARPASERTKEAAEELWGRTVERFEEGVGVRAMDERTLVVELERPLPYALDLLAFVPTFPAHPPTIDAYSRVDAGSGRLEQDHGWTKPPHLVSSGPFVLTSWRFKRDMRLERNPFYWDVGSVRSESIEAKVIEDPNTRVLAFRTGAADWVTDVHADYLLELLAEAAGSERPTIRGFDRYGTYFWSFNCTLTLAGGRSNPFADARVRRAFSMAVDKRAIVEDLRGVGEHAAETLVPRGTIRGYDEDGSIRGLGHDPAGAREELARAGWRLRDGGEVRNDRGETFPVVTLLASTGSYHVLVAQAMASMWEKTLGVRTSIVVKETKTYRDDLKRRDYMVARGGWFADYADPTSFLNIHVSGDGNNDRGYSSAEFDQLMREASEEREPAARMAILERAEQLSIDEAPIVPIWVYRQFYQYDASRLTGVCTHPRMIQFLHLLQKKGDAP